jgi:hypothetical protein
MKEQIQHLSKPQDFCHLQEVVVDITASIPLDIIFGWMCESITKWQKNIKVESHSNFPRIFCFYPMNQNKDVSCCSTQQFCLRPLPQGWEKTSVQPRANGRRGCTEYRMKIDNEL